VGEDVQHELADVLVRPAARVDRGDDGGEVVVRQDHRGRLARDIRPRSTHGHFDVGVPQRRGVVHAVAGHRDHLTLRAQGLADAELALG